MGQYDEGGLGQDANAANLAATGLLQEVLGKGPETDTGEDDGSDNETSLEDSLHEEAITAAQAPAAEGSSTNDTLTNAAPGENTAPEETALQAADPALPAKPEEMDVAKQRRPTLFARIDFRGDRMLFEEEQQEWNAIYASFRSKSILTGEVIGDGTNTFMLRNPETGLLEETRVRSLVIVQHRVKVLIPQTEAWASGEEMPDFLLAGLRGDVIDYVIISVDKDGGCAIGSRRLAMQKRQRRFLHEGHAPGDVVKCRS